MKKRGRARDSPTFQSLKLLPANGDIVSEENGIGTNGGIFEGYVAKSIGKHIQAGRPSSGEFRLGLLHEMLLLLLWRDLKRHPTRDF